MTPFILTKNHVEKGLKSKDFSAYAGIPVVTIDMMRLPHWDKLSSHITLEKAHLSERSRALHTGCHCNL
jgi:hypothetical protein